MITVKRNKTLNKITFFKDGIQVYPENISGNIARFENDILIKF